jgi:HCO3- transporter family
LIAQGSQFPLRKPAGFHYDFALLGLTTFLAGLLGIPAPNGLIPQAPIHTRALLVHGVINQDEEVFCDGDGNARLREVPIAVVEQRVSNLAQGSLCLVLLSTPFLHVLHLVPQGLPNDPPSFTCPDFADNLQNIGVLAGLLCVAFPHALPVHPLTIVLPVIAGTWALTSSPGTVSPRRLFTSSQIVP